MPRYLSWIGDKVSEGFFWDDIPPRARHGNQPNWRAPRRRYAATGLGFGYGLFQRLQRDGRFPCKQLDWGGWGVLLSGRDCLRLWDETHGDLIRSAEGQRRAAEIRADIEALDPDGDYVLFIAELA